MIKTTQQITILNRGALLHTDTQDVIIYGRVTEVNNSFSFDTVTVMYDYYTLDENNEEVLFQSAMSTYSFAEAEALKSMIPTVPTGLTEKEEMLFKYKEAMKLVMAQKFQISTQNIIDNI